MSGRKLSPAELAAGAIVSLQLGGEAIDRDGEQGSHDFDIELPDGRIVALEVTSATDGPLVSMYTAAFGETYRAPKLEHDWWIGAPSDASLNVKRLMGGLEPHLAVLEQHGVAEVNRGPAAAGAPEEGALAGAFEGIFELGANRATRLDVVAEGQAQLLLSTSGGVMGDPDQVNELVAARALAKAPKLRATTADERHVFVWIDGSQAGAELAMFTLPPPPSVPELPDGVDAVWVATAGKGEGALWERLWILRPPGGWERIPSDVG